MFRYVYLENCSLGSRRRAQHQVIRCHGHDVTGTQLVYKNGNTATDPDHRLYWLSWEWKNEHHLIFTTPTAEGLQSGPTKERVWRCRRCLLVTSLTTSHDHAGSPPQHTWSEISDCEPRSSAVDSQLAKQLSLAAVSEILNGCMWDLCPFIWDLQGLN